MKRVLFVCLGNLARSQMAEAFYNKLAKKGKATSAGTFAAAADILFNHHASSGVIKVMKEKSIDISKNKVTQLTKEMIEEADEIYVLCSKMSCPSYLLNSKKATFWKIEDPLIHGIEFIRETRDKIERKVTKIV